MNLNAVLKLDSAGFTNPLAGARAAFGGFTSMLRGAIGPLVAISGGVLGVAGVIGVFKKALQDAAADESLNAKLTVLTKDAKVAAGVLSDLNKFSDDTPFEPEPIMRAGVALIGAKFAAKDVRDLLQDMGDLASGGIGDLSENLNEITSAFARLKSGQSGEALEILRRFSISSEDLKAKGLKFDAGGQMKSKATDAIDAVRAVIRERFGGTMAAMAKTTEGLWSTLQGNIGAVFREFGKPLLEPVKQALAAGIGLSGTLTAKAKEWGQALADAGLIGVELFKGGQLGAAAGLALKIGFGEAVNFLAGTLKGVFVASVSLFRDGLLGAFRILSEPNTWKGLELVMVGLAAVLSSEIEKGLIDAFSGLTVLGKEVLPASIAEQQKAAADVQGKAGKAGITGGAALLGEAFNGTGDALFNSLITAFDKFTFEVKDTNIVDTGKLRADLATVIDAAKEKLKEARAAAQDAIPGAGAAATPGAAMSAAEAVKHGKGIQDGDRLTKIGLLVGARGSTADLARRTADNTAKMATGVVKLIELTGRMMMRTVPTGGFGWAS